MKSFHFLAVIFLSYINVCIAQWEYQTDDKKNEIISVNDKNNNSSFLIERKKGKVNFYIKGVSESECKVESIEFRFDGIKDVLFFKVENLEEKIDSQFQELLSPFKGEKVVIISFCSC